jgi:membrane protease subunit (stomatin/prohibitin family)
MGLWSFIKGQFIEIIEWPEADRNVLVWKFPDQDREIKMGAQLIVRDSQAAIFINEGQIADVYGPGRYELTTRNMPILSRLRGWKYGFESPFKVDIYFVSTRRFRNLKWGTKQPIPVSDPEFSMVPLRAFGTFDIRVSDPATFFRELVATDSLFTTDELMEELRSRLVTLFSAALKASGKTLAEINMKANLLGEELLPKMQPEFAQVGLELLAFNVESVTLPEEIQNQLVSQDLDARGIRKKGFAQNEVELQNLMAKTQLSQNIQDMQKYLQFQMGTQMGKSDSGTPVQTANFMQQMVEMGIGMHMAKDLMKTMNQDPNQPSTPSTQEEVLKLLKELGELKEKGILTEEEFAQKKQELLSRL